MFSTTSTENERHNGWANYPTWAVNLWLTNDQELYNEALQAVREMRAGAETCPNVRDDLWTVEEARRYMAADMLKDWVTDELAPDLGASFAADLLSYALGEVEWHEIADGFNEAVLEETRTA